MGYTDALATSLRVERAKRHIDQKAVADGVGITQTAVSQYENGDRVPGIDTIVKLADFYGVSLDYLAGRRSARS